MLIDSRASAKQKNDLAAYRQVRSDVVRKLIQFGFGHNDTAYADERLVLDEKRIAALSAAAGGQDDGGVGNR